MSKIYRQYSDFFLLLFFFELFFCGKTQPKCTKSLAEFTIFSIEQSIFIVEKRLLYEKLQFLMRSMIQ